MKYIISLLMISSGSLIANAVYISEIMYNPDGADTGREWVEVYNDGSESIDLTSWKLFENGVNHGISTYSGGNTVPREGYAVIADNPGKFLLDFPSYNGILFDSAFSLSNTGEQLILKNNTLSPVDTVTYDVSVGGDDDGSTISLLSSVWQRSKATPGSINEAEEYIQVDTSDLDEETTENQKTVKQMSPPANDMVLYIPKEKVVVAGAVAEFSVYAMTKEGKNVENLISNWAFGDGGQATGTTTNYRYAYPGRYIATVEGSNGSLMGMGRMIVNVVAPELTILNIGNGKYGTYIDIKNPSKHEIDMSQWKLAIDGAMYPFPKNTFIAPGISTRFSGEAMGFASTTIASSTEVKVLFPTLEEVIRYQPVISNTLVLALPITVGAASSSYISKPLVNIKPVPIKAPVKKVVGDESLSPAVLGASTTTMSTSSPLVTQITKKDTRLITWFKRLFGLD